jgi:hypothetical protein
VWTFQNLPGAEGADASAAGAAAGKGEKAFLMILLIFMVFGLMALSAFAGKWFGTVNAGQTKERRRTTAAGPRSPLGVGAAGPPRGWARNEEVNRTPESS